MDYNFFIDIAVAVLLRLVASGKIPKAYVKALIKLRDALNLAFPLTTDGSVQPAKHIQIV